MLVIRDLSFSLAGNPLFDSASATIPEGRKVGVVGRNGAGKTTLFRLIRGELTPDAGQIEVPRGARIGGVEQEAPATADSLLDTVLAADAERAALLARAEVAQDPAEIAAIQTRLADIGAHSAEARAAAILNGLGFDAAAQARPCAEFSGGWRMRVALAAVLFSRPDLLLLDEPTNYLDLEGAVWLEGFLANYPATTLVISHDRGLLNRAVQNILHLEHRKLTLYGGRYDQFERERRLKLEQTAAMARKQEAQRAHIQSFVDRFRYKASKARQAQARLKMLERMEPIAAVVETEVRGFVFPSPDQLPPPLLAMEDVAAGYDGAPVLRGLRLRIDQDDRIALLGANGQGKSTLSKLIAGRLAPMSGELRRAPKLRVGYFAQHQVDELTLSETPLQHLQRLRPDEPPARLRALLARGGIDAAQAQTEVASLSGGQKARLTMLLCALDAPHLLVLDEPTNHLDIESRQALAQALAEYEGAVILVSHDPHLVESVADRLWLVRDGAVREFDGDMDDYRRLLLSERGGASGGKGGARAAAEADRRREARRAAAEARRALAPLRDEVRRCEARVAKLEEMRARIDARLMDPDFYMNDSALGAGGEVERLQIKRGEILEALERAEALWMDAQERLEEAERRAEAG
ncbi:ABC-F family ATP-binding cassette domain-containing protein [Oceanicella actignis]|uniref:ATP-binding cassette, subfamily F, member 3 n=1 Tax=Oceanicella actignis TaxID=1189325 RepID=A0A1M7RYL0_9RHOB|nr:ABC-F family ATP-binding cassette domain-containing protein [Oceanicella actignis]SES96994.1 ATP-binding cassette, subfamily F, member 3 [Oceanicella actignis]SHN51291.1 ATP-binding cassette, subfamily F, member 3 [Oceanicella actignis]